MHTKGLVCKAHLKGFFLLMRFPGGDPWSGETTLLLYGQPEGRPRREGEGKPCTRRQGEKKKNKAERKVLLKGMGVGIYYLLKARGTRS